MFRPTALAPTPAGGARGGRHCRSLASGGASRASAPVAMASAEAAAPGEAPGDEAAAASQHILAVEDALMLAITFGHIVAVPYTKVEESFNVQQRLVARTADLRITAAVRFLLSSQRTIELFTVTAGDARLALPSYTPCRGQALATPLGRLVSGFWRLRQNGSMRSLDRDVETWWELKPSLFLAQYDHFAFPGVVPRTFIGAIVVSLLSAPLVAAIQALSLPKLYSLYAVRLVQGALLVASFSRLRRQVAEKFGMPAGRAFALVTASQFHLLYYCSRPLPNSFALSIANLAYAFWLQGRVRVTLSLLVFGTVAFRCDLLILLGPIGLSLLLTRSINLWRAVGCCMLAGLMSLGELPTPRSRATVIIDSYMWRRWLWPEGQVLWFNTALDRSSEWGVSPVHWYFTSALPRSLLGALPLALVGTLVERKLWQYIVPAVTFLVLYSKLPHKVFARLAAGVSRPEFEPPLGHDDVLTCAAVPLFLPEPCFNESSAVTSAVLWSRCCLQELRFILPALPLYNMAAAVAVAKLFAERRASGSRALLSTACGALLLASWAGAQVLAIASYLNYPGGQASGVLHNMGGGGTHGDLLGRSVHVSVLPAMTGFSRFCERGPPWKYSKEEGIPLQNLVQHNFTFLLSDEAAVPGFGCLATVTGFSRLELRRSFPPLSYVLLPKVYIHKRLRDEGPVKPSARATYNQSVSQVVLRELMTTSLVLGGGVLLTCLTRQATKPKLKLG
eukprot:SM000010S04221  [mRNA]  locus=s10:305021:310268:+ [translate_table: standard]